MKNLNLSEFNTVELSNKEASETNGGIGLVEFLLAGAVVAATQIVSDWENFKRGFSGEPPIK